MLGRILGCPAGMKATVGGRSLCCWERALGGVEGGLAEAIEGSSAAGDWNVGLGDGGPAQRDIWASTGPEELWWHSRESLQG